MSSLLPATWQKYGTRNVCQRLSKHQTHLVTASFQVSVDFANDRLCSLHVPGQVPQRKSFEIWHVQYCSILFNIQSCPDMSSISPYLPLKVHVDHLCATVVPTPCIGQTNSSKNVLLIEEQCAATRILGRSQQNSAVFTKVQDSRSRLVRAWKAEFGLKVLNPIIRSSAVPTPPLGVSLRLASFSIVRQQHIDLTCVDCIKSASHLHR